MNIKFGYGKSFQEVKIPEGNLIASLKANPINHERTGVDAVNFALQNPIASKKLSEYDLSSKKIAIITSDISRPLPSWDIMPSLLDELYKAGATPENIVVVLALGSHREHTEEEKKHLVGDRCFNEVAVVDSNVNDCVSLGKTHAGTPIDFDRRVVEADFRIALGNVEFHYFAGYSGGYKALMPGVSTPSAIQANHSMMTNPKAVAGNMEGNPVRDDINEAGAKLGLDFIVNAVLDEHKNIVFAAAGNVKDAHEEACAYLDKMYRCEIPQKADIVLVSQGGAPKDANLYQTQKALENAKYAVKDGGTIIVIGACNEGLGSAKFKQWFIDASEPKDLIERVESDFELGGHKAAAIAMVLDFANIDLVSEMDPAFVESLFLKPKASAQQAFDDALAKYGDDASVIAMPFGGATLPVLTEDKEDLE